MDTAHLICSHNYALVALSVLIAIFASYAALDLAGRVTAAGGWIRAVWLLGGAGAMGTGIWSMHYIGMLACILPVPVAYHWPTVLLSLFAAVLASAIALYLVSRQKMGAFRAFVGSILMGGGIASMHYIGMAAMRLAANCHYNSLLVVLSVVFAVLISLAALWITFHLRDEKAATGWRKIAGAVVMGAAIPVMHYTGMAAAHFTASGMPVNLSRAIGISTLGTAGIVAATLLVLGLALLTSSVDRRFAAQSLELQEAKLQRSEAYLSEAQRLSHTGSFGWKVATGKILWSEETFRIFQYDRTTTPTVELILQRVHPEDRDFVKQAIGNVSPDSKDFNIEHRLVMPDGSVKHLQVVAHAEKDKSGKIEFVGAVMDVTVAKEAQDKIRLIINTVPGLLWTARPDGWVDFLNQRWLDYTGMTLKQGLGWAWQPGYHPDDLGNVLSKWRAAVAERKPLEVEARLRRFDGEYRWFLKRAFPLFDNAGHVLGWYGGNIDIHDLKQAEEALRRSENYLAEAQRLTHTGSWVYNVLTGELVHSSEEHRRLFGFDPEKGMPSFDELVSRIHPEDRTVALREFETATPSGEDFDAHFRIVLPDGTVKYVYGTGHPVFNPSGAVHEFIGMVTDVTERKRAEEALRQAQADLAHVSRLTTMGELTASIAHEVNQPLTAVVNNANACLDLLDPASRRAGEGGLAAPEHPGKDGPNLEEVREALAEIIDDAGRASAVIVRVRQLAKRAPIEKSLLDLKDVVNDVLSLARYESATRRVTIRIDFPRDLPPVSGDRVQLQQVLLNLVMNGMDAMNSVEEQSRILVLFGKHDATAGTPGVLLCVQDAGIGFKPEDMDRLFEAFYTTKSQGLGMGLALSRSIIEAHGGHLWAELNPGPGATFSFALPAAPKPPGEGGPAAPEHPGEGGPPPGEAGSDG
jgi:PAS domain S-box-containing protein